MRTGGIAHNAQPPSSIAPDPPFWNRRSVAGQKPEVEIESPKGDGRLGFAIGRSQSWCCTYRGALRRYPSLTSVCITGRRGPDPSF